MASKHKIKRIERALGYTKASHKSAVIYFSKEKPELNKSLKRKKVCKFTKGDHEFVVFKVYEPLYTNSKTFTILNCKLCGKKKYSIK